MELSQHERVSAIEALIGVTFQDKQLILDAITHRTYVQVATSPTVSYERLEFLGDSMLHAVMAQRLYRQAAKRGEGVMTHALQRLISNEFLGHVGHDMGLHHLCLISASFREVIERDEVACRKLCADILEALIGAVSEDQGFDACRKMVEDTILARRDAQQVREPTAQQDRLAEMVREPFPGDPVYIVRRRSGREGFLARCKVSGYLASTGEGMTANAAKEDAARMAIKDKRDWWNAALTYVRNAR